MRTITRLLIFMALCVPFSIQSQTSMPTFIGKVISIGKKDNMLLIKTEHGNATLTVFSPSVLRFRITRQEPAGDFSWAVIQHPEGTIREFKNEKESAVMTTDSLEVIIHKNPLRFIIRNLAGEVISEELPRLPVSWLGTEVTTYRKLFPDEKFLGLGEKTGNLNKRGAAFENWNSDVPAYAVNHDPLYQSIPFFIGVHDKVVYGIFLDNSYRTRFNFGASTDEEFSFFSAADGEMNYYFFGASTMAGVIRDYTWLTGRMPLPPYWSLGYQQCRWSYYPESQVMSIARQLRDKEIPCDVIYLDIDYMDAYKIFTWNKERFPDPKAMISKLNGMGFHVATIVDPGIKIDDGYFAYRDGIANDYFAKYPDGSFYTGSVWPGRCHFPDFTSEKVRKWWGSSFNRLIEPGVEGFWNDMNEPSAWGQNIPNIVMFDFEGKKSSLSEVHNIYGLEMSRATFEGTRELLKGKRTFALTRAGYAGIQRYSAVWTGDNYASDEHMLLSARMVTGLGLSGVSFTGPDVGGFMGNPSEELYTRWMSLGSYTPFFRNHSAWETRSKEPWAFGINVERMVREMIRNRYRLLPYIYSAFYESVRSGMPVARSLAIPYPFDEKVYYYAYQNQYMFGDNILVAPVSAIQSASKIYLPAGNWYRFSTDELFTGHSEVTVDAPLNDLPVFVRASGIIPMQSDIQHTGQAPLPVLDIHIYAGTEPSAFAYYEDDGSTYEYEKGDFFLRQMKFDPAKRSITFSRPEGTHGSRFTSYRLVLHGFNDLKEMKSGEIKLILTKGPKKELVAEVPAMLKEELTITY